MTTQPTHWIAGTGQIIPVVLLETGIGGHTPKYTPPDPVVVRSVEDYYEFVASEGCLFTDRTKAILEAKRLREVEKREARIALARIERKELLNSNATSSSTPNEGSSPSVLVVEVPVESRPSTPQENVVQKKSTQEDPIQPQTLLQRVIYVVGRDNLSFDDLCNRLQQRNWMPKRRSSVSNVLSANKNLFLGQERGMYSLRSKPKSNPVDFIEDPEVEVEASEEEDSEEDLDTSLEASNDAPEDSEEPDSEETSEFSVWMNRTMKALTSTHSHYRDADVVLSEKVVEGKWVAEIFVSGLELWYEGVSEDRAQARVNAEQSLRSKAQALGKIIDDLGV